MNDTYDDGLVHCHNWACSPETPADEGKPQSAAAVAAPASAIAEEHSFDDGLVHGHDWARA